MREFIPSNYQIIQDGRTVVEGAFCSDQEILGFVARRLPEGVYQIFRLPPDSRAAPRKVFWAEVTNHGEDCVTYRPDPPWI